MLDRFDFRGKNVRVIFFKGIHYFVAMDIADILDYKDARRMCDLVDAEDKLVINPHKLDSAEIAETFGSNTFRVTLLTESGLYACIFSSHKSEAKEFKKWVTSEVLISIRKTGSYSIKHPQYQLPQNYLEALKCLVVAEEEKILLQKQLEQEKVLVAVKDAQVQETERIIIVQNQQIEEQKEILSDWHPLVQSYKDFLDSDGLIGMGEAARMLDTGRNRFIKVLRLYGYLMQDKPLPYQKWMKYFEVKMKRRTQISDNENPKWDAVSLFKPEGFNKIVKTMVEKAGNQEILISYLKNPSLLEAKMYQEEREKIDIAEHLIDTALS